MGNGKACVFFSNQREKTSRKFSDCTPIGKRTDSTISARKTVRYTG